MEEVMRGCVFRGRLKIAVSIEDGQELVVFTFVKQILPKTDILGITTTHIV